MIAWTRRLVLIARTRFEGLLGSRWRFREAAAGQSAGQSAARSAARSVDRSVGTACTGSPGRCADGATGRCLLGVCLARNVRGPGWHCSSRDWPGGWSGGRGPPSLGAGIDCRSRHRIVLCAAVVDMHRLRHGPVAFLATHQAVVSADVEIRADPHRVAETGMTSGAAVVRAAIVRIEGRGGSWLVRAPVLVIVSGPRLEEWLRMPVGTRVVVDGRMESPDRGSDVAAVLRVRSTGVVVAPPAQPAFVSSNESARACGRQLSTVGRSRGRWCPRWYSVTPRDSTRR